MTDPGSDSIKIPETVCLVCGDTMDTISSLDNKRPEPKPGQPVLCLTCGAAMTFENGRLRPFTKEEIENLDPGYIRKLEEVRAGIFFVQAMHSQRK